MEVKSNMLRYRGPRQRVWNKIKQLDAFDKVQEVCVETSPVGGSLSIVALALIAWLLYSEISFYAHSKLVFKFSPDTELDAKLKINIDMTVAMPCALIGADILDSTNQNVFAFGELKEEDTWFELSPEQALHFESVRHINSYLREEYHAVSELLWRSGQAAIRGEMPARSVEPQRARDACRVHGSLVLNKVAGNFHITVGKSLHLPRGHIHLSMLYGEESYNFSHRIDRFSFGESAPGIVYPLEGDRRFARVPTMLYQYFIDVVPTEVDTAFSKIKTYQYSAKEHSRPIDHGKGSHGMPGIFFKYDMAALKLKVSQERDNLVQFTIRLFSMIGGIYIITGYINSLIQTVHRMLCNESKQNKK